MEFNDLKDIVMIYSSDPDGKPDYSWDKAKIVVWNTLEQRKMNLTFTGSNKGETEKDREIHFNVSYAGEGSLGEAFRKTLKVLFPNIRETTVDEYEKVFFNKLLEEKVSKVLEEKRITGIKTESKIVKMEEKRVKWEEE